MSSSDSVTQMSPTDLLIEMLEKGDDLINVVCLYTLKDGSAGAIATSSLERTFFIMDFMRAVLLKNSLDSTDTEMGEHGES